ncbi:MAG TPA: MASE1 domain-containing protein [Hyphomicrobiaceae bacterium]|nr:MASE1 domain-containing protein [Hyphomicrobiaceae bacterium]
MKQAEERTAQAEWIIQPLALPRWWVAPLYLSGYVLLDHISFVFPLVPFGITPWNPPTGLSFVLILLAGRRYLPLLFLAPFTADFLLRGMQVPLWVELVDCFVVGTGYAAATMLLLQPRARFDPGLSSRRDLLCLLLIASVSSGAIAFASALLYALSGLLAWEQFQAATFHYWVGDAIGVFVVTPFLLSLFASPRLPRIRLEMAAQLGAIILALGVVFTYGEFYYLLFLPIIWTAVRHGLKGASAGLFLMQAGLIVALEWTNQPIGMAAKFQFLMLILALTGLLLGMAISEQRRAESRLRLHEEALARASRLSSLSALAATLAHEVNQPLTAIGNYARVLRDMIRDGEGGAAVAVETSEKLIAQVDHAAKLIRRFREFVRTGRSEMAPTQPRLLIEETLKVARPLLDRANIEVSTSIADGIGLALVDRLQIEKVLLNLIRNSAEAIALAGNASGRIAIEVAPSVEPGFVDFKVSDDGPGFSREISRGPASSFMTTKLEGLGLGLTLTRGIIERHAGRLRLNNNANGAVVTVSVPVARETDHAA